MFFFSSRFILNFNHLFDIGPPTIPSTNQGDVMNCSKELTWPPGDTKLLFECWKIFQEWGRRYYTRSLRSLVKYFSTLEEKFRISARPSISTSLLQLIIHRNCLFPRPQKILFSSSPGYYNRPKRNWAKFRPAGEHDLYQLVTCKVQM